MNKVIRDGKVAVLISPGFGAGWSTWLKDTSNRQGMLYSPALVAAVEAGVKGASLQDLAEKLFPGEYIGGAGELRIEWVTQGTRFRVAEYDGSESIEEYDPSGWEE